jgi:hypothetical protein
MRHLARKLLALILCAAMAGPTYATNPGGGGADNSPGGVFDSERTIDRIPLIFADEYRATVLYLFIVTSFHVYALQTLNAVVQRNENRLPAARIPLLGQLVRQEYQRADFAAERQVGTYYQIGKSLLIDLRPASMIEPAANVNVDWDRLEAKLAAEARTPIQGEIQTASGANNAAAQTLVVFNRDSSYTVLLGGAPVSEEAKRELLPFMSNLLLIGHTFRKAVVTQRERQLLLMVKPSIVERAWD